MVKLHLVLWALAAASNAVASAHDPQAKVPANLCGSACDSSLGSVTFSDMNPDDDYYTQRCTSTLYLTSIALCLTTYCRPAWREAAWAQLRDSRLMFVERPIAHYPTLDETIAEINDSSVIRMDTFEAVPDPYNNTVLGTQANYDNSHHTEYAWAYTMLHHHAYGWAMYILLGCMLLIGIGNRFLVFLASRQQHGDAEDMHMSAARPHSTGTNISTWYRRYLGVPALFGYRHQSPWGWIGLPTRIQSVLIFIYVLLNFIWTFTNYEVFKENVWWPDTQTQWTRYFADRTGIMSFYNLPLLWALAGRNDVIMWLTGWNYDSLNLFHRWAARVATIQAIAHSAAYTWLEREELAEVFTEQYWVTGVVAMVTMAMMLPLSVYPIRKKVYELFLIIHISLALPTLVLLFYHVKIFVGEYDPCLWACSAIWCFDRLLRIVRVVACSWRAILGRGRNTVATMTGGSDGLVRIAVLSSFPLQPRAGEYYFLYTPKSFVPWENHPFTLASWEKSAAGTTLNFLLAPQAGFTRRIERRIERASASATDGKADMTVLLEGPYGAKHHLEAFDQVLFVAGGSGITCVLPYVFSLGQAKTQGQHHPRRITVVWVVKNALYAADVLAHELAAENADHVDLEVHITREDGTSTPGQAHDNSSGSSMAGSGSGQIEKQGSGSDKRAVPDVHEIAKLHSRPPGDKSNSVHERSVMTAGRPVMSQVVAKQIAQLVGSERLAVLGCGPQTMMDDLRKAVVDSYGTGERQVPGPMLEYFEEAFGW